MIVAKSNQDNPKILPTLPGVAPRMTREVFNIENVYLGIGDKRDRLLEGISFADPGAARGDQSDSLRLLALVTVFQFAEDIADRPACVALSRRMDWQYALRLPPQYPGLKPASLCSFRQLLVGHSDRLQEFQCLLDRCAGAGLLGRGKRDAQAVTVVDVICRLNQLERMHEALSQAIGALACHQPEMLRALAQPHWYHRYQGLDRREVERRVDGDQQVCAQALGADARHLLQSIANSGNAEAAGRTEVRELSKILEWQYELRGTTLIWRNPGCKLCPWLVEGFPVFHSGKQQG